ncbi:hypothetical protein JXC34_05255 [Candidatus Woesearchaeota archaeon]|nr:hypothetical protein [Candidatus Woesearchaeota archaeon]
MQSAAKAYGKLLVFGAYSILEPGNIGLVVNIDKGTTTSLQETHEGRIVIDLENFEIDVYGVLEDGRLKLKQNPEIITFVKNSVEYSFRYLNKKGVKLRDIRLISYNDPEMQLKNIKTGFGSSATSTVSAVAAVLSLHDVDDRDAVYKISRYAHYKSQGDLGSGFDISSSCYGSHFFMSEDLKFDDFDRFMSEDISLLKQSFDWPYFLHPVLVFTGQSASTTELVRKVLEFRNHHPEKYASYMKEYNENNIALRIAFEEHHKEKIKILLEKSWHYRKLLGEMAKAPVEPDKYTRLMNEMKEHGAFTAGLVGAGGGDSILALCTTEPEKKKFMDFLNRKKLTVLDNVNIVNKGYEIVQ